MGDLCVFNFGSPARRNCCFRPCGSIWIAPRRSASRDRVLAQLGLVEGFKLEVILTRRANQRGLHNVRFAVKDAETFLRRYVPAASIAEIHLYHPQPYHDRRRAHRRVLTPRVLADVHRALQPGGLFVVQTDNPDYWAYMTRVLPVFFDLLAAQRNWVEGYKLHPRGAVFRIDQVSLADGAPRRG